MHLINLTNKTNMYEKCQTIGLKMAPHVSFYCQNCTISVIQHMITSLIAIPQSSCRNRFNIKLFTHYEKPSTQCTNSLLPMIPQFTLKNTTENKRQYNGGIRCAYKLANAGPNKDTKNLKLLEQALPGKIEWPSYNYFKVAGTHLKQPIEWPIPEDPEPFVEEYNCPVKPFKPSFMKCYQLNCSKDETDSN